MCKFIIILTTLSILLARRTTAAVKRNGSSEFVGGKSEVGGRLQETIVASEGTIEVLGAPSIRKQDGTSPDTADHWLHRFRFFHHKKPFVIETTELTAEDEKFVTDEHNRKRSEVEPVASDMLQLVYDRGLADLAKSYSQKCVYEHSHHPQTEKFEWPGENIFISTYVQQNITKALDRATHLWFHEREYYSWSNIEGANHHIIGHYTQMVWASNYAIGCGATTCGNVNFKGRVHKRVQLVVCYYGPGGNYLGEHPYHVGLTCSHCPPHKKCVCKTSTHHSGNYN